MQAAESRPAGYMLCFCFLFIYLFLTIPVGPIEIYRTDLRKIFRVGIEYGCIINLKLVFLPNCLKSDFTMAIKFCWF